MRLKAGIGGLDGYYRANIDMVDEAGLLRRQAAPKLKEEWKRHESRNFGGRSPEYFE